MRDGQVFQLQLKAPGRGMKRLGAATARAQILFLLPRVLTFQRKEQRTRRRQILTQTLLSLPRRRAVSEFWAWERLRQGLNC